MKVGDLVKWRNSKSQDNSLGAFNPARLDESWFHYAVVVDIPKSADGPRYDPLISVLWRGDIFKVPDSILCMADDTNCILTLVQKQKDLFTLCEKRK